MRYRLTAHLAQKLRALDPYWLSLMSQFGFKVVRAANGWVTYDGSGTIAVVPNNELDPDDTLAQILLHELIHHFVQGQSSYDSPDWGLDNTTEKHVVNEHAALLMQAALLDIYGLRNILIPTTDFRSFYEHIPLPAPASTESEAQRMASRGLNRLMNHPAYASLNRELTRVCDLCEPHHLLPPT